jgi:hypothetical protein
VHQCKTSVTKEDENQREAIANGRDVSEASRKRKYGARRYLGEVE